VRAVVYTKTGGPDVLTLTDRAERRPGAGEVRVAIQVSGVNPTDWKVRSDPEAPTEFPAKVPNQDGAGVIDAVGPDVSPDRIGERVWLWEVAYGRSEGTAQHQLVVHEAHAVLLPDSASMSLGAALGIPFLTAHRCLTIAEFGPESLGSGALAGRAVLVAGGAGAVGNAAIQLARWSGATVIATVSNAAKAALAKAAGADHVINYRDAAAVQEIREITPVGVDLVVEVAPMTNLALNQAVLADNGTIAVYANEGSDDVIVPIGPMLMGNVRWQFVGVYTVPQRAKAIAIADVTSAIRAGAIRIGCDAGLPIHRFSLDQTAQAHAAVEGSVVGRVLIDIVPEANTTGPERVTRAAKG